MKKIKEILDSKGRDVLSVAPDTSIYEAVTLMAEREVGALLVMKGDKLVGLLSERDCTWKVMLEDRSPRETKAGIMVALVLKPMVKHRESCLPKKLATMTSSSRCTLVVPNSFRAEPHRLSARGWCADSAVLLAVCASHRR